MHATPALGGALPIMSSRNANPALCAVAERAGIERA
jgi:hypothetical protein